TPPVGAIGSTVVITGTNFTDVLEVTFDGEDADFTVNSPTQITATVPDLATSGPVEVVTLGGTAVSPGEFTVAPPAIAGFSPTAGAVGSQVVITGTNFTGALLVLFNGEPVLPSIPGSIFNPVPDLEGFTVDSPGQITVHAVPDGATTGPIIVLTPGGVAVSSTNFTVS